MVISELFHFIRVKHLGKEQSCMYLWGSVEVSDDFAESVSIILKLVWEASLPLVMFQRQKFSSILDLFLYWNLGQQHLYQSIFRPHFQRNGLMLNEIVIMNRIKPCILLFFMANFSGMLQWKPRKMSYTRLLLFLEFLALGGYWRKPALIDLPHITCPAIMLHFKHWSSISTSSI